MSRAKRRRNNSEQAKAREASFQELVQTVNRKARWVREKPVAPYGWAVEYFPHNSNTELIVRPSVRFERSCAEYRTGRCVIWFGTLDEATRFADGIQAQKRLAQNG